MPALYRFTTEYVDVEDRICLTGQSDQGIQTIWLSLRLLQRLLPILLQWLQARASTAPAAIHEFAQQAAESAIEPQPAVDAADAATRWFCHSVDITHGIEAISIRFRNQVGNEASLSLTETGLRQWLAIIHAAYVLADWPMQVWPDWIGATNDPGRHSVLLLH